MMRPDPRRFGRREPFESPAMKRRRDHARFTAGMLLALGIVSGGIGIGLTAWNGTNPFWPLLFVCLGFLGMILATLAAHEA